MDGPPLGPGGEDINWPDQVAPRGRKASSTRKIKPQTSNLKLIQQTKFNPFTASSNPFCLWYSHSWTFLHSSPLHIIFTWIKGHADFPGNDYSDAISKWASNNINYPPGSHHQIPLTSFITSAHHSQVRYPSNLSNTYSLHTLTITYTSP